MSDVLFLVDSMLLSFGWSGQLGRSRRQPAAELNARRTFTLRWVQRAHGCRASRSTERAGGPFHPDLNSFLILPCCRAPADPAREMLLRDSFSS